MPGSKKWLYLICLTPSIVFGSTPGSTVDLNAAIRSANSGADTTITFANSITMLPGELPGSNLPLLPLNINDNFSPAMRTITINGAGFSLSGSNNIFRGFFIRGGGGSVTINNLTFSNCTAAGGSGGFSAGGGGGGGGGGAFGGALFIGEGATVTLSNLTFSNCRARGGPGGEIIVGDRDGGVGGGGFAATGAVGNNSGGGGGGGVNGSGGISSAVPGGGGGGGAFVTGIASASGVGGMGGGNAAVVPGGGGAAGSDMGANRNGGDGMSGGGGGGGGIGSLGVFGSGGDGDPTAANPGGAGGGGGAAADATVPGGAGGMGQKFAGGGGGGHAANTFAAGNGGSAGFAGGGGGGGGANSSSTGGTGGTGGFGGGGGGGGANIDGGAGAPGAGGSGGFGAGSGGAGSSTVRQGGGGGGGAAFGGALFLEPTSTVTIMGSVTFTGSVVTAGIPGGGGVAGTSGTSGGTDIYMMSSSELIFNISSDVTLTNPIEGDIGAGGGSQIAGGLTKQGSAKLVLTGPNTYTGLTHVNAGELNINSTIITDTLVDFGGTLSGDFTIASMGTNPNAGRLTNNGIVSPGTNGVGTITIEQDYFQGAMGRFVVDVTPDGQNDRLFMDLTNMATLDGTLEVVFNGGNYIEGTTYTVINAPVVGTFSDIVKSGPNADRVFIDVTYSSVVITIINNLIFQDQIIQPGVAAAVAFCFTDEPITPGTDFGNVTELMGLLSNSGVNAALISLSPVQFGALEWINERNNSYVADLLSQHLFDIFCSARDCCSCDCNASVWATVFGNLIDQRKHLDNLNPYNADAIGGLVGIDWCCGPGFYYGASVGYTHTHVCWKNDRGKGDLNSYYGALYGSWRCSCYAVDLSVLGGGTDQDLERRIKFTGVNRTAKSDPWAYFVTAHLGLRADWEWCCWTFEPFALGDYHYYARKHFKEKGAQSLNLNVRSKTQDFIRAEAGLRAITEVNTECGCFAPYIGLSWVGEFPLEKSRQKANFVDRSCLITVESYHSSVQLASPQGGVKYSWCNGASLIVGYKGLFNNRTRINEVEARFEWLF